MLRKMIEKTRATIETQFNQWYESLHRRTDLVAMAVNTTINSSVSDMSQSTAPLNNNFNNANNNFNNDKNGNSSYSVSSSLSTFADAKEYNNDGGFRRVGSAKQSSVPNNNSSAKNAMFNDEDVDSDISAFYQAKEELLKQRGMGRWMMYTDDLICK